MCFVKTGVCKTPFRHSHKWGDGNLESFGLFMSNVACYGFSSVIIEIETCSFVGKWMSGKRKFRHRQKLGHRSVDSLDRAMPNGVGYVFFDYVIVEVETGSYL